MKRLIILRHAKSRSADSAPSDRARSLSSVGWNDARRIGRELRRLDVSFDLVVASPATRARQTIVALQEELGIAAPILFNERMYLAGEEALLGIVRALDDDIDCALLVGHNPGLQSFILELLDETNIELRQRIADRFPTAALALTAIPTDRWPIVQKGTATIVELIVPNALD